MLYYVWLFFAGWREFQPILFPSSTPLLLTRPALHHIYSDLARLLLMSASQASLWHPQARNLTLQVVQ